MAVLGIRLHEVTHKQGKGWRRRVKGRLGDVYNRLIPEKYSAHVSIPPPRIRSHQILGLRTRRYPLSWPHQNQGLTH